MARLFTRIFGTKPVKDDGPAPAQRDRLRYDADEHTAVYAIGDVHGCYEVLIEAERRIVADAQGSEGSKLIVLLGDYVDRGSRSKDVLQHLCSPPPDGFERVALCGNHDDMFLRFLRYPLANRRWLSQGGRETLYSYGIDADYLLGLAQAPAALASAVRATVPASHVELLESMPILLAVGDTVFVHAGIRPGIPLEEQTDQDLLWIREPFLSQGPQAPLIVVHGHTPDVQPVFINRRIGIDTAAFATGNLTILRIVDGKPSVMMATA
jgi:serine/threonine protein phosphatase 1